MATEWQLQDAKSRFSELVNEALRDGPQTVTRRGEPVVMVVAMDTWLKLAGPRSSLKELLRNAPLNDLDLTRETAQRPNVDLP